MAAPTPTIVYTDGACQGNPGPGGWAWAVPDGPFRSGAESHTTNQRMELHAVLDAVGTLDGPLEVVSDSTYVVNCFKNRWWEGWERKGWKNAKREDVANQDLWRPLVDAYKRDGDRLAFRWVKGHSSDRMNDLVDRLAVEAASRQEGRRGQGTPSALGPADGAGRAPTGRVPGGPVAARPDPARPDPGATSIDGHPLVVTGLRPAALGGYGETAAAEAVRRRLSHIIRAKAIIDHDLVVVTGLDLGAEQLGAEAARDAGVAYVAVLAFPGTDQPWPPASRARFARLLAGAEQVLTLEPARPEDRQAAGAALGRRDRWLAATAQEAVVVWDGADPNVGRSLRALQGALGEEQVWVLEV